MTRDVYQIVTDRIVRLLESGTVPWHQPWKGGNQWPQNLMSRKLYRGINQFLLNAARYPSPFWLTFRQVHLLGGSVKKGEKSFPVVFWKRFKEEGKEEARPVPFLRYYSVFNVAQCEGITLPAIPAAEPTPKFQRIEKCEWIVAEMPKRPPIHHHGGSACYSPTNDEINMPDSEVFESIEGYYSTLFHELTHSTGHVSRLNRKEVADPGRYGSYPYSREELVAEMGAAFLCGHCEIENKTVNQSASYIQSWLEKLKNDRKLVVHAAAQAQRACDFILSVQHEEEGPTQEQPKEFKVVALRECPVPESMRICDTPESAAEYWREHVVKNPYFNPDCECFVVLLLNTRRRVRGHQLVSIGTLDSVHVHPRDVFRAALVDGGVAAIVLMHNHPSGEPTPSDADVKITRDLIRAGQLVKIEVIDHIVMGNPKYCSLRELGHFYS